MSSTADQFPLPFVAVESNGILGSGLNHADDFNGAALTPIPWLSEDSMTEWPRSDSDILTVEQGSAGLSTGMRSDPTSSEDGHDEVECTQVPTAATNGPSRTQTSGESATNSVLSEGSESVSDSSNISQADEEKPEERPHARGPDEIGMEDIGNQSNAVSTEPGPADSIEAAERAVGRPGEAERIVDEAGKDNSEHDLMVDAEAET